MIDFMTRVPGWLLGHPWLVLLGVVLLGASYLLVFAGVQQAEARREARDRYDRWVR